MNGNYEPIQKPVGQKQLLNEVVIIRFTLIIFLVLYHSFAPYSGAWQPITDEFVGVYYWISKFTYSFFLGSFVFISGYLYAYSEIKRGSQPFKRMIKKKCMRLLIPSIIFSSIYLIVFGLKDGESLAHGVYTIIEGRGHMWFLPMLFWLFVGIELLKLINMRPITIIVCTLIVSIFAVLPLPFCINLSFRFLVFFYLGYVCMLRKNDAITIIQHTPGFLLTCVTIYLVTFIAIESFDLYYDQPHNALINLVLFYGRIIYTLAGTIALYGVTIKFINDHEIHISNGITQLSGMCFGVYLYQQFILIYLYYHTDYVNVIGGGIAPWAAFAITLIASIGLSYLTLKTRIGRALIG